MSMETQSGRKKEGKKERKNKEASSTTTKEEKREGKMKERGKSGAQQQSVDEKYTQWKSLVPVLYDWLANHNLVWPSLSCR